MTETWKPALGYEGFYEVSDCGNVRSLDREHLTNNKFGPMVRHRKGKLLSRTIGNDGYVQVRLCRDGNAKTLRLARVVLSSFIGVDDKRVEACHLDHDRKNNKLGNLAWGTRQENEDQKSSSGNRPRNTVNNLTCNDVQRIRVLRNEGLTLKDIGALVGTHFTNVSLILRGKTWVGL